jgi:hypothetical protein
MPRRVLLRSLVAFFVFLVLTPLTPWQRSALGGNGKIDNDGTIDLQFKFDFVPSLIDVADAKAALQKASEILCDATDGQARIENVRLTSQGTVLTDMRNYETLFADIRFLPVEGRSNANLGGLGVSNWRVALYRNALDGDTIAHELGHYVFSLRDEYAEEEKCFGPCFDGSVDERNHCIMQINYAGVRGDVACSPGAEFCSDDADCAPGSTCEATLVSEFCTAGNHDPLQSEVPDDGMCGSPDPPCSNCSGRWNSTTMLYEQTGHSERYGESCWETLERLFPFMTAPSGLPDEAAPTNCFLPINFTDALAGRDEYILVVDRSGSMAQPVEPGSLETRLDYAKAAVRAFIDIHGETSGTTAGLESFATAARLDFDLAEIRFTQGADGLRDAVDALEAFGLTATGSALQLAANVFRGSAQQAPARTIVLLSDGQTNIGPDPVATARALQDQLGVSILTVPIGAEADRAALAELAGIAGGKTIDGLTGAELPAVYGEIAAYLRAEALVLSRTPSAVSLGIVEGGGSAPFTIRAFASRVVDYLLRPWLPDARAQGVLPVSETFEIPVEPGANRLTVLLSSRNPDVTTWGPDFTLSGPGGETIDQDDQTGAVRSDPYYRVIIVDEPSPGTWTFEVSAVSSTPQHSYVQAQIGNPLPNCLVSADPRIVPSGASTRIFAEASYLTDLEGAITFEGTVRRPDGSEVALTFARDLDTNENSAEFNAFVGRGLYEATVTCKVEAGATPKRGESIFDGPEVPDILVEPFERTATVSFFLDSPDLPPCTVADCDGDGIPNDLEGSDDQDGDGLPCDRDTDCDGDDVSDADEGTGDSDGDGTPDFQDPDADDDCLPDGADPNPTIPDDPICGDGLLCPAEECDASVDDAACPGLCAPPGAEDECTCRPRDHYKCYKTRQVGGLFGSRDVTLEDQFTATTSRVHKPRRLCNPVDKDGEGIDDPTAHLMCYKLQEPRGAKQDVVVENQFGVQALTVTRPDSLCIPAEKDGVPSELQIDHFKCYKVRRAKGAAKFASPEVVLEDQFETKDTLVVRPRFLCNPVDKNGEGILDPESHLVCYRIEDVPGQPRFRRTAVEVMDQFADQDLKALRGDCRQSSFLCVPSTKRLAGEVAP